MTNTGPTSGVEWVGGKEESPAETDARGWPILHADDPCDGINPLTDRPCVRMWHTHYHRDATGVEWLDDD